MDPTSVDPSGIGLLQLIVVDRIPFALVAIALAIVATRASSTFLNRLGERFTSYRLLVKQVSAVVKFTILVGTAVLVVTSVIHLTDQAVLALGGSVAVAVGFAIKDLLAALMAGIILLFDRPFVVGDRVKFGDTYGEVVEIGLRTVRIVTLDDDLVSIPNNLFLSRAVACANAGALDQMCVFKFSIGPREDFELAKRLVYEAVATSRFVYLRKPVVVHVREGVVDISTERFGITITGKGYVLDGRFEVAFGTDVTERVMRAFRAAGIRRVGEIDDEIRQAG